MTAEDRKGLTLYAGQGVAVREVVMAKGHGRADYLLYADQKAVGGLKPSTRRERRSVDRGVWHKLTMIQASSRSWMLG